MYISELQCAYIYLYMEIVYKGDLYFIVLHHITMSTLKTYPHVREDKSQG